MKYLILFSLFITGAYANLPATEDSAPPMPKEQKYKPNDGTARAGNPGSFTSKGPAANVPETKLSKENHQQPKLDPYVRESQIGIESEDIQAQESNDQADVLDVSSEKGVQTVNPNTIPEKEEK